MTKQLVALALAAAFGIAHATDVKPAAEVKPATEVKPAAAAPATAVKPEAPKPEARHGCLQRRGIKQLICSGNKNEKMNFLNISLRCCNQNIV